MKNPKNLIFILFLFTGIINLTSQTQKWELGIAGGPGIVYIRPPFLQYPKNFKGIGGGLSLKYQITKRIAVLANLMYEEKQHRYEILTQLDGGQIKHNPPIQDIFQHVSLPVILNCSFGKKTKFFINAGAYLNYLIKQYQEINTSLFGDPSNQWRIMDVTGPKRFDTGVILGFGMSQALSNVLTLSLEARSYSGLYNIAMPSYGTKYYMNYQCLLLGISCKFGKIK